MEGITTYTLDTPATKTDIIGLMKRILEDIGDNYDCNKRVELCFGTVRLLAKDEREREQYPNTVTAQVALDTLDMSISYARR